MPEKAKTKRQKPVYNVDKQAPKTEPKQPDFYHKHKSTIWTIIILVILTIFFIINNTRKNPEQGPYPPNYNQVGATSKVIQ